MDELDRKIREIVSRDITEPDNLEEIMLSAIRSEKGKKRIRRYKIMRTLITSVTTIFITAGVGVAGFIAYEKIWKDPQRYTYEEVQNTFANVDNVEEKENTITEDEAKEKATTIMNNLGYSDETIKSIVLEKDINNNDKPFYRIMTGNNENEGLVIVVDASTGKLNTFVNNNFQNENIKISNISESEAEKYAEEIMNKVGLTNTEYEFTECKQETINNENIWTAKYYKIYDGLYNPYELLTSNFVVSNNAIELSSIFETKDGTYDNNPTVITEDEAKNIAIAKEKELTSKEIENVSAEMGIRKMNKYIYRLENNIVITNNNPKENETLMLEDNRIRKVWIIKIIHKNIGEDIDNLDDKERLKSLNKIYYIDITTGEIIGGEKLLEGGYE